MSRRIALPGADELFRSTGDAPRPAAEPALRAVEAAIPVADAPMRSAGGLLTERDDTTQAGGPTTADQGTDDGLAQASASVRTTARRRARAVSERAPSGRQRHEEKITVYVSADELMDLEHARLTLRGDFGLSVDRGRVVREALAVVLADLESKGEASILVRRLRGH